jgi:alpha-glucosidase
LTLRGTPFLYQGDEIGLTDGPIERDDVLDAVGTRFWPYYKGRDAERTPMPWSGGPGGGFTTPGTRPWLPMADPAACNVADQEGDPGSVLELTRRAIAARTASDELAVGPYRSLDSPEGTWAFRRGEGTTVLLNLSDAPATFDGVHGTVTVATGPELDGSSIEGALTLPAWSGAVVVT